MGNRILLLENSDFFGRAIKQKIETILGFQVLWYRSIDLLLEANIDYSNIDMAILDFELPQDGGPLSLDLCFKHKIPTVLLANSITHDIQEKIWNLKVIDYILKGHHHTSDSLIDVIRRYFNNPNTGILVVDESKESRDHLKELLHIHKYKIYEATNGLEAIEVLNDNYNKIQLVITDYIMPKLDGLELTSKIRKSYPIDRLAIIGISAQGNHTLKVQFIKSGANDFLNKPFISELLYCRITQNLKIVEYFQEIKNLAIVDQLTKLNNRHFLKETGPLFFENAVRHNLHLVTAMIDIDDFKAVNDTYGHDCGDLVLKEISHELKESIRKSDLAIRYGGEEFLIIGNDLDPERAFNFFDALRQRIFNKVIILGNEKVNISVSIGLSFDKKDSLENMINNADKKLYEAKTSGKNRVCI
ncbi:MAG: diguanylate cyclase [Spirochaetaceae bacterium]